MLSQHPDTKATLTSLKTNTLMDLLMTKTFCLSEIESVRNSWEG